MSGAAYAEPLASQNKNGNSYCVQYYIDMSRFDKYTGLERKAFLATCLLVLVFWAVVMTTDSFSFFKPLADLVSTRERSSREVYCMKPENKKRKYCMEGQIRKKEQWDEIVRSSGKENKTAFSLTR
jgi:hypothetical protein